jgi:hypothetical protein
MNDSRISRRTVILSAVAAASIVAAPKNWLPGNVAWAATGSDPAIAELARLLFPHSGLDDDIYADIAEGLFTSFAAQPGTAQLLDAAENALDAQQQSSWFDADEDVQIAALENIQGEAFFAAILAGLRGAFYYHPKVWASLNYPGSSKEHGGYKHRGFDDIDWLPEIN